MWGIPTGRLCPGNLVADVCGDFVTADLLTQNGLTIPGRDWNVEDLRVAAEKYIGLDLVTEVLSEEMHPDMTIEKYYTQRASRLLEHQESNPEYFKRTLNRITKNIAEAQRRLRN